MEEAVRRRKQFLLAVVLNRRFGTWGFPWGAEWKCFLNLPDRHPAVRAHTVVELVTP